MLPAGEKPQEFVGANRLDLLAEAVDGGPVNARQPPPLAPGGAAIEPRSNPFKPDLGSNPLVNRRFTGAADPSA
jgi:hypothetical protein